jgi:hypothetical protein
MLSRRSFLNTTIGAGAMLATPGPQRAAAQVDRRMIVDAQVHLWKAESEDWKWVPGLTPQLPEPFTIERLVPMMDEAGVDRVVIVPPSWPGDRNDYALEAVRRYPTRFRIMGKIPLQDPKSAALLPRWREQPGMAGLRVIFNTPQTEFVATFIGTVNLFHARVDRGKLYAYEGNYSRFLEKQAERLSRADQTGDAESRDRALVYAGALEAQAALIAEAIASPERGDQLGVPLWVRHPAHMAGSDGIFRGGFPHPRGWGSFARLLGRHTRELGD